jgi:predicted O-methyltransferase YrrM
MLTITDPRIEDYILNLLHEEDPVLAKLEEKARASGVPVIGPLVGRLLYLLARMTKPRLVLELGSGFGYSGYWLARGMEGNGKIVLTDYSESNMEYARQMFQQAGMAGMGEFLPGNALETAVGFKDIDLLLIDTDKYLYPEAAETMLPNVAVGGLVIADNTLWHGTVVEDGERQQKESAPVRKFNEYMASRRDFFTTIIPLRDGVMLSVKN